MRLSLNHDLDGDEEQGGAIHAKKDDICIETLRSIRSEMNIHLDMESLHESLYSPRSCPICCEDSVKGDDVALPFVSYGLHSTMVERTMMIVQCFYAYYMKEGRDLADC